MLWRPQIAEIGGFSLSNVERVPKASAQGALSPSYVIA
jgi:hypothetical protein